VRYLAVAFVSLSLGVGLVLGQTPTTKKKTAPKSTKAAVAHTAPATAKSKAGVVKTSTAKTATKSKHTVAARRPPVQMQPSTDRYKEIQQALSEKGYFRGTPDGAWNGESVDALKHFQKDQNLDPDGKIGALSLMALGLGPKRGTAQAASGPADPPPVAQPQP
jgi:murein L,D-transpeptidase YcbB/YkuD